MAKQLSILFVTSEVYPYAKESGLGDVSFSFPLAMRELGHDIRVMTPKYGIVSERKNKIHEINRLRDMPIPIGDETDLATVKSSSIANPRHKVQAYITTNSKYFDQKKGIYHDAKTWEEFPDNAERFIFFCRSVVETCMLLGWYPDIIHCNDWQTAIIPAFLRTLYPNKFKKTRSILTIHNAENQGVLPLSMLSKTGLSKEVLPTIKHKNMINILKAGIVYSNYVTTVSKSYEKQLLTDKEHTNGLNSVIKEHAGKFCGIMNGIEPFLWNPATDDLIASKFEGDFDDYKYNNKAVLAKEFELEFEPNVPIIGIINKITETKGFGLLIEALPDILKKDVKVVILGQGDAEMKEKLAKLAKKNSEKLACRFEINDSLAHKIEAGSDIYLLPSKIEPFGLNLMYSLAYGALPVVHKTGGFEEVGRDYNNETGEGNCFMFEKFEKLDFVNAVMRALEVYKNKNLRSEIALRSMSCDYSWGESAQKYDEIYRAIMKEQM